MKNPTSQIRSLAPIRADVDAAAVVDHLHSSALGVYHRNHCLIRLTQDTSFWNPANDPTPSRLAVFVHEYLHFVHNFSTVAGLYDFVAQLRLLRPFCNTVRADGRSVGGNVLDSETRREIAAILKWRTHLRGGTVPQIKSALGRKIAHPPFLRFRYEEHEVKIASQSIPCVGVVVTFDGSALSVSDIPVEISLGSEVLMEGCAVEAECIVLERTGGSADQVRACVTAYPYLTARSIFEGITGVSPSSKFLCCVCVLALQSTNPSEAFIKLANASKPEGEKMHLDEDALLARFLANTSAFFNQRIEAILTQMMPLEIAPFELRGHAGRGLKRMLDWGIALFECRLEDSFFEFDALDKLPDLAPLVALLRSMPVCPVIQEVDTADNDEEIIFFSEQEMPASVMDEIGAAQSLLHFASTHLRQDGVILETPDVKNRPCFFSKACQAPLAKEKSIICKQTPWEAFAPSSGNGCWYALGVAAARALMA